MKILAIGDIFSKQGRKAVAKELPKLKQEYQIDFVIANAENTTHGRGLCWKHYEELVGYGVDCITMGNHTWDHPDIFEILTTKTNIIRPYNIINTHQYHLVGSGSRVFYCNKKMIRVTNLLGNSIDMKGLQTNPFESLDKIIAFNEAPIHIVDFHAETTSEKNALFLDFKGKLSLVYGTHTHIPTNDARIVDYTAFQTDLGMCGAANSVIGANPSSIIQRFRDPNKRFILEPSDEKYVFCASLVEIDDETNLPTNITPVVIYEK